MTKGTKFYLAMMVGVASLVGFADYTSSSAQGTVEAPNPPDITSVIKASVKSIQEQNQLLVMTTKINTQATSETSSVGMTAERTDIQSNDVQYLVDLSQLSLDNITVTADKLTVVLPATTVLVKPLPAEGVASYDNNSWLFTFSNSTGPALKKANQEKIATSIGLQSAEFKPQAINQAKVALTSIFEAPLRATGFKQTVEIIFS